MAWKVVFSNRSRQDLERITRYIAQDDEQPAEAFVLRLVDAAERLRIMPHAGAAASFRADARFLPIAAYLIIYRTDEKRRIINILRFWHSARGNRPKR